MTREWLLKGKIWSSSAATQFSFLLLPSHWLVQKGEFKSLQVSLLAEKQTRTAYVKRSDPYIEEQWNLQPFQRGVPEYNKRGEHETFIQHIQAGLQALKRLNTVVVFSGGWTTDVPRSEARSYVAVVRLLDPNALDIRNTANDTPRLVTEELATDSYQNLLFSIAEFRMLTGEYPNNITVITHAFKERRFLELHAKAIKWPADRFRVQGINPPFTLRELNEVQKLERERAYDLFATDPYGTGQTLAKKRRDRKWDTMSLKQVKVNAPEDSVRDLLDWTGGSSGTEIFPGKLPWENIADP